MTHVEELYMLRCLSLRTHFYFEDFISEFPMHHDYPSKVRLVETVEQVLDPMRTVIEDYCSAYKTLTTYRFFFTWNCGIVSLT